jgi:lipopolysaccharide export system protein LptA
MKALRWLVLLAATLAALPAAAQATGPFAGFGGQNKGPINIEADGAQVFDKEKRAVFKGNVNVTQGDVTLKTSVMTVYYTGSALGAEATPPSQTGVAGQAGAAGQQIRRLEATGKVVITSKDQVATGDQALYKAEEDRVVLSGNVTLTQGPNVVQGEELVVDLKTGVATVKGRVRTLIVPSQAPAPGGAPAKKPAKPG